jgi:hypothetical protein
MQAGPAVMAQSLGTAQAEPGTLRAIYESLLLHSNMLAFVDAFRWLALVCFIVTPLVLLFKKGDGKREVMMH